MPNFSYKTSVDDFSLESLTDRYDVSGYSDIDGVVTFYLSRPQKAEQLQEELQGFTAPAQGNEMVIKTRTDIAKAMKAELALLRSGFNVVVENGEIEISSSLVSEENAEVVAEYFKIYIADMLGLQGGEYYV